ncbi:filamentous hemagglutinin N-terminal domain-containing protein [Leptolyngbyaceae cyanobacterium CCMR0082]|uniref:Filamentous hemagglutinin N-terminal domain-containing protein n=1 Tax=Adonisia turfae CCMR0082 TaxID=2304604 RepID=A0A6M0S9H7_9CYAN|nr:filamentous hemagglutinin N-terminal domain-containing protein [Adonisia turfae]NEZ64661.1 filamentous hemagglutinin N-terminal domain-containing protein [Adonisia turfae CCMR0082]
MAVSSTYACLTLLSSAVVASLALPGLAQQVIPDNTLGAESSVVTPLDGQTDRIDGGALRDATLFHSFGQFGIPENYGVYFANPDAVNTIFSRVTGADPSLLFGTLGVLGDADLVFLNPNGILFGPNAELDLRGGFTATTASGVAFPGGEVFSAVVPETAPLLSVNVEAPIGLVFGDELGAIANAGNLIVDPEQGLTLMGSVVINEGNLTAPAGQISLTAVLEDNLVQVASSGQVLSWDNGTQPSLTVAPDVSSVNELVNALGLNIVGDLNAGTNLVAGEIDVASSTGSGGDIQVLGDRIALLDAHLNASGQTGGGNLLIGGDYQGQGPLPTATQTYFDQASTVQADALQSGHGGRVIVWADDSTHFYGDISVRGGASSGDGGFVEVSGRENLAFQGFVDAGADNGANGTLLLDPQDIRIVAGSSGDNLPNGVIRNGNTITLPQGLVLAVEPLRISENALEALPPDTDLRLEASNNIFVEALEDSNRDTDVQQDLHFSSGPGGKIEFIADADNDGQGSFIMEEPSVTIIARQRDILISGEEITVGSINTTVPTSDEAVPDPGSSGSITLRAIGDITTTGSFDGAPDSEEFNPLVALGTFVSVGREGNGGTIKLISSSGSIDTRSGRLSSDTPNGIGGDIILRASLGPNEFIDIIEGSGGIQTATVESFAADGAGGNITIQAVSNIELTQVEDDTVFNIIDSSVFNNGDGGRVEITSENGIVNTTQGRINASSFDGTGGEILIEANQTATTGAILSSFGPNDLGNITLISNNGDINTTAGFIEYSGDRDDVEIRAAGTATLGFISSRDLDVTGANISHIPFTTINASRDAKFTSTLGSTNLASVFADNSLEVRSNGTLTASSLLSSNGTIDLASSSGNVSLTSVDAENNLEVRSNGTLTASGLLNSNGTIDLVSTLGNVSLADVSANNLQVDAGGNITSTNIFNITENAEFTSRQADAGSVELAGQSDITFGNSIIGGDLSVDTPGTVSQIGVLQVAGDIEVNGNNSNGPNGPLVNTVGNPNQETTLADGSVVITQVGTVELEPENYPANLTVNSLSEGILRFDTVLKDTAIDLSNSNNSFGGTVQFRTETGNAEDTEIITGIPGIVQSGPISVAGAAIFDAENGNIKLTDSENLFLDSVEFTGNDVDLTASGGLNLLASRADGNLRLETGGLLQQSGALGVDGTLDLTVTLPEAGNVTLANGRPTLFGQTLIGGKLTLEPTIPGTNIPIFFAEQEVGTSIQAAGGDNLPINFERDALPDNPIRAIGDDIFITDVGPTNISEILDLEFGSTNVAGDLTVYSFGNALKFDGAYTGQAIQLDDVGNQFRGPITITTDAPTIIEEFGKPGIVQSEQLTVTGTATFNAADGAITLTEATNQFGELAFEGENVLIQEQDSSRLGESFITGTFNLISGGEIIQRDNLQINGASSFTTLQMDAPITLDQANQLAGPIAFNTQGTSNVTVTNTVTGTQLAESAIGGDLTVDSGSAIAQTGPVTVSGTTTLNTGSNDINLALGNDFNQLAVTGSGTVDINDINAVDLLASRSFGDFTVTAQDTIASNNISVSNGTIQLTSEAGNVDTTDGLLRAQFVGGQGGNVNLKAEEDLTVGEILVSGFPSGNVDLTAENGTLLINDFDVRSITFGSGTGGTVTLNGDTVELARGGRVLSSARNNGTGGTVNVNARQFLVQGIDSNGSTDEKFTTGIGTDTLIGTAANGGNQNINATELIQITGTRLGVFEPDQTDPLAVLEASALRTGLTASSLGSGTAGDINLNTERLVLQNGVGVATAALGQGADAGDGGDVTVTARDIEFRGLAGLASATLGQGVAGNIVVRGPGSTDEAPVPANQLFMFDGGIITADAIPEASQELIDAFELDDNPPVFTGQAGNIDITANDVLLDNNALITTSSTTGSGGDITLDNIGLLRLRRGNGIGGIITDGGTRRRTGDGGQIDITADLILAIDQENSDISATAFIGRGGGIEITTLTAPIGIEFRPDLTPFSDITAGSDQGPQGTVNIDTAGLDPTQGTANLPDEPRAPELIQGCQVSGNREATEFFDNGRGGTRPSPDEAITPETVLVPWIDLAIAEDLEQEANENTASTSEQNEAQNNQIAACSTYSY